MQISSSNSFARILSAILMASLVYAASIPSTEGVMKRDDSSCTVGRIQLPRNDDSGLPPTSWLALGCNPLPKGGCDFDSPIPILMSDEARGVLFEYCTTSASTFDIKTVRAAPYPHLQARLIAAMC